MELDYLAFRFTLGYFLGSLTLGFFFLLFVFTALCALGLVALLVGAGRSGSPAVRETSDG